MAGKPYRTRRVRGVDQKRCAGPDHQGERWLPFDRFPADRSQPSGHKSHCCDCYNAAQKGKRDANPEVMRERNRGDRAKRSARRDVEDLQTITQAEERARAMAREAENRELEEVREDAEERVNRRGRGTDSTKAEERARRQAAERQERLASDFANLRPDDFADDEDFDTGIANDKSAAGKALSAQAAREKRQEFSRAMGKHMGAVRRAAVAAASGSGDLIDSMPAASGDYIGRLAEQERRFGNRRLARSLSLFAAGEEQARRLWVMAMQQYLTGRVVPAGYAKRPPPERPLKRSVCCMLSDLHIGADLSGAENPMRYGAVEEARRLEYVMRQAIDYKPQYRAQSELVLMLNGDLIEGQLGHDFRDGAPLAEQKVAFQSYMDRFIGECARAFPRVRVFCQPGNHGRDKMRHPGRATSSKWDGHEWVMYKGLEAACRNLKNVSWDIPFRAICKVDLHGAYLLQTHADTEVKLGHPDKKAAQNAAILDQINANLTYGVQFDAGAFGHYHTGRYIAAGVRQLWNAALIPPNGHARTEGYGLGEACGQWLWEAVENHPVGDVRFIEVGPSQDRDERLGTIIKPCRFNLE